MDGVIYRSEMRAAACHVDGQDGACHVDGQGAWRPLLLLVPLRLGLEHLNEVLFLLLLLLLLFYTWHATVRVCECERGWFVLLLHILPRHNNNRRTFPRSARCLTCPALSGLSAGALADPTTSSVDNGRSYSTSTLTRRVVVVPSTWHAAV